MFSILKAPGCNPAVDFMRSQFVSGYFRWISTSPMGFLLVQGYMTSAYFDSCMVKNFCSQHWHMLVCSYLILHTRSHI